MAGFPQEIHLSGSTLTPVAGPRLLHHPDGITAVDAEYLWPGHAAAHIIHDGGRAAFVDVGTSFSVPYLLGALDILKIPRRAVDYVFITHVHLDHAGGAGRLLEELPNAQALLHPRGAPHMIDPERLIEGSKVVYGEERFNRLYGRIVPIPADRVRIVNDAARVTLGARELTLLHSPGHALHHYVVVDPAHRCIFSGDTFGISYRELDTQKGAFITPTTTPTQFDPDQLIASIDRMLSYAPASIYLMHYSRVTDIPRLAASLKAQIPELVRIALAHADSPEPYRQIRDAMWRMWLALLAQHGCTLPEARIAEVLQGDLDLNTQGLIVWLERRKKEVPTLPR
jgi:glyoxylase-like metal-dependent hydrolase (beta-lactamase superfamily II)